MRRLVLVVLWVLVGVAAAGPSQTATAAELAKTEDGSRVLANKNINGERWAIAYDATRQDVTGNVLLPNGDATFIECSASRNGAILDLRCQSFSGGQWRFLANTTLPVSFFGLEGDSCTSAPPGITTVSYSDSCGITGTATIYVGTQDLCHKNAALEDASDPRLEGAQLVADFDSTGGVTYSLTFHGACQGTATGSGRVTDTSDANWRAEGSLTGDASCCRGLTANIGLQ